MHIRLMPSADPRRTTLTPRRQLPPFARASASGEPFTAVALSAVTCSHLVLCSFFFISSLLLLALFVLYFAAFALSFSPFSFSFVLVFFFCWSSFLSLSHLLVIFLFFPSVFLPHPPLFRCPPPLPFPPSFSPFLTLTLHHLVSVLHVRGTGPYVGEKTLYDAYEESSKAVIEPGRRCMRLAEQLSECKKVSQEQKALLRETILLA